MANCSYTTTLDSGDEWKCPLEALHNSGLCYWHKEEERKEPTQEQLEELKEREIFGVYLRWAELQHADLGWVKLQHANLKGAKLQNAHLRGVKLQKAYLMLAKLQHACLEFAEIQEAYLTEAKLQHAHLGEANLQNAHLKGANLRKAILTGASLQGTNLHGVRFDSETTLEDTELYDANLFRSYFDEAKSFRHAKLFYDRTDKEINEIIGDALRNETLSVLDLGKLSTEVAAEISNNSGLVKYTRDGTRICFFDKPSKSLIKNPEIKDHTVIIKGLSDLIHKGVEIQSEYLYNGSRADQFEASYEVYNNLYNFYIANGNRDQAGRVHYRRGEAYRKLLREKGGLSWLRSWCFDFLVLWLMAGYGD